MALRFAVAYPQSVRSLVLADSALDGHTWSDDWQARWYGMREAAKTGQIAEAKRRWLEHLLFVRHALIPSWPHCWPAWLRTTAVRRACHLLRWMNN
jgi:pimeloyl-ACP methyl ester carboxylesterase